MKRLMIVVAVVALIFLAGSAWMYWTNRGPQQAAEQERLNLQAQLRDTQDRLRAADLEGQLGLLLIDVEQNNFGEAQQSSTKLFDGVRAALTTAENETVRHRLEALLQHRDEVTASLTALKPGTADVLRGLYVEFAGESGVQKTPH